MSENNTLDLVVQNVNRKMVAMNRVIQKLNIILEANTTENQLLAEIEKLKIELETLRKQYYNDLVAEAERVTERDIALCDVPCDGIKICCHERDVEAIRAAQYKETEEK